MSLRRYLRRARRRRALTSDISGQLRTPQRWDVDLRIAPEDERKVRADLIWTLVDVDHEPPQASPVRPGLVNEIEVTLRVMAGSERIAIAVANRLCRRYAITVYAARARVAGL